MSVTGDLIEEELARTAAALLECDRLRAIIEVIGEALGDLIGDVGNRSMVDWHAGGQVYTSWGDALRVLDDVYVEHLEAEEKRVK